MVIHSLGRLGLRAVTLGVWALAAGSAVYWGLRLSAGAPQVASLASRFALQGVVAGGVGGGAALIALDGKPARSYRVGSAVEEGLLLQSVAARRATLAAAMQGPAALTLEMPPLRQ